MKRFDLERFLERAAGPDDHVWLRYSEPSTGSPTLAMHVWQSDGASDATPYRKRTGRPGAARTVTGATTGTPPRGTPRR